MAGSAAEWATVPIQWNVAPDPDGGWQVGDKTANPFAPLPLELVRGHWVRLTVQASSAESGISTRLNVFVKGRFKEGSIPEACDSAPIHRRCSTIFWVPQDSDPVLAVAWASLAPGRVESLVAEVSTTTDNFRDPDGSVANLVSLLQKQYYRSAEVDRASFRVFIARLPAAPADADVLPAIAQHIRNRLPRNKHTLVWPTSLTTADPGASRMPTCRMTPAGVGILEMPGLTTIVGAATERYAQATQDCLMAQTEETPWLTDLRKNTGGNMYPMISGLAPRRFVPRLSRPRPCSLTGFLREGCIASRHAARNCRE